jgi:hypothetical protein
VEGDEFEMNGEERRVVELARAARTPGDADKRRVRAALAATLGAATVGAASSVAVASAVKGAGLAVGARVLIAAVLLASAAGGAYYYVTTRAPHPVAPAPVPPAPAPVIVEPLPQAAAPAQADDPLMAELTLLRQAQRALREGDARRALDLAARHAALYPRSQMTLERGALRVFAFCALGRKAEARALARELIAAAPSSPMRKSLEESCGMR